MSLTTEIRSTFLVDDGTVTVVTPDARRCLVKSIAVVKYRIGGPADLIARSEGARPPYMDTARSDYEASAIRSRCFGYMETPAERRRYVLALADDATMVEATDGVTILRRLPSAILVETDLAVAEELAGRGKHVLVYHDEHEALMALSLFDRR